MLTSILPAAVRNLWREYRDRSNSFYRLEYRARQPASAGRPFILFGDQSWTYAQVYEKALRYGAWLRQKLDVRPKDVVAVDMQNSDEFIFLCFGLWAVGAKPAFVNYNLTGEALTHCVRTAGASLMLVDPEVADNVDPGTRERLRDMRIEVLTPQLRADILATEPVRYPDDVRAGELGRDMCTLIYTSGTTGLPKGAIVSWSKMTLAGGFVGSWLGTQTSDIFYTVGGSCLLLLPSCPAFFSCSVPGGPPAHPSTHPSTRSFRQFLRASVR